MTVGELLVALLDHEAKMPVFIIVVEDGKEQLKEVDLLIEMNGRLFLS